MMKRYEFINQDAVKLQLKTSVFPYGGRLSKMLSETAFNNGVFFSYVPQKTTALEEPELLIDGFQYPIMLESSKEYIEEIISNFISGAKNYAVFEDILVKPDYPYLKNSEIPFFLINQEVFWFLHREQLAIPHSVLRAFSLNRYAQCVLSSFTELDKSIHKNEQYGDDLLECIVKNMQTLIITVYDDTGYLIWERRKPN